MNNVIILTTALLIMVGFLYWLLFGGDEDQRMNYSKYFYRIELLRNTFIKYVKKNSLYSHWTDELEVDFEWIDTIYNRMRTYKYDLIPVEMKRCNKLYRKYNAKQKS